jgi:hypothetical protein
MHMMDPAYSLHFVFHGSRGMDAGTESDSRDAETVGQGGSELCVENIQYNPYNIL